MSDFESLQNEYNSYKSSHAHTNDEYNRYGLSQYNSGVSAGADVFHFPRGYSLHSTALGETFPGFGSNVIPICIDASLSRSWTDGKNSGGGKNGSQNVRTTVSYNGKTALTTVGDADVWRVDTSAGVSYSSAAYAIFLPVFFNFDYSAIQANITSGTITVWLQKN